MFGRTKQVPVNVELSVWPAERAQMLHSLPDPLPALSQAYGLLLEVLMDVPSTAPWILVTFYSDLFWHLPLHTLCDSTVPVLSSPLPEGRILVWSNAFLHIKASFHVLEVGFNAIHKREGFSIFSLLPRNLVNNGLCNMEEIIKYQMILWLGFQSAFYQESVFSNS